MSDTREAFEVHIPFKMQLQCDDNGRYLNERVRLAWEAWQAASEQSAKEIADLRKQVAERDALLVEKDAALKFYADGKNYYEEMECFGSSPLQRRQNGAANSSCLT